MISRIILFFVDGFIFAVYVQKLAACGLELSSIFFSSLIPGDIFSLKVAAIGGSDLLAAGA